MAPLRLALLCALGALPGSALAEPPRAGAPSAAVAPIERPQDRHRGPPLRARVFGRPLEIRGELETSLRYEAGSTLEGGADSFVRFGPELRVDLSYALAERALLYTEILGYLDGDLGSGDEGVDLDGAFGLTQAFLDVDGLLGGGVGLRVGRQGVFEERGWWWDADLDAVRLRYERGPVRAELAAAWQLARLSTDPARDPEDDDLLRLLGHVEWALGERYALEAFLLLQDDRSAREAPGRRVREEREDPSDADVGWVGLRASGTQELGRLGEIELLLEAVWMRGREVVLHVDDETSVVASHGSGSLRGHALIAGASWEIPLPFDPALTVEYAFGSGDGDLSDGVDGSFRQTGLQSNEARFDGVSYFDVYGALLRPELSNLHVVTLGLGVPILRASSVDLVLHLYRQAKASPALRARGLDALPDGERRELGHALDLVVGLREWSRVEVEVVASAFRAGPAFGSRAGRYAFGLALEVELEF